MNTIQKNLFAGLAAVTIITTTFPAPSTYAATTNDLQAQVAQLLARIQTLQTQLGTASTSTRMILPRNLAQGMQGEDVRQLQIFLNADPATTIAQSGPGSKGNETTYFGPATKAAVIKFQNKHRTAILTPAGLRAGTGFVGTATRSFIANMGNIPNNPTPTTPTKPTTPSDQNDPVSIGEEGEVDVTRGGEHTNTLDHGSTDAIYSLEMKAVDSAITIDRIDFWFNKQPWNYIDSFALYHGDKKIADLRANSSSVTKQGDAYRLRFSDLAATIGKDTKDNFSLKATALKSISNRRAADTLEVYVPQNAIRAQDTRKYSITTPDLDLAARSFDFRDGDGDGSVVARKATDSPIAGLLEISARNTTAHTVLITDLRAKDNDITINDLYLTITSSTNVADVVRAISLRFKGDTIATESVRKNGSTPITGRDENNNLYTIVAANEYYVHLKDIDGLTINEDTSEQVTFVADLHKQAGRYNKGITISFTLRAVEGENEAGEDIVNANLHLGDDQTYTLHTDGVTASFNRATAATTGSLNQTGKYTIEYALTAFGNDIYLPTKTTRNVGTTTDQLAGTEYLINTGEYSRYTQGTTNAAVSVKGAKLSNGYYRIIAGSTATITLSISLNNTGATSGFYQAALGSIRYKAGSSDSTVSQITTGLTDFVTNFESLNQ